MRQSRAGRMCRYNPRLCPEYVMRSPPTTAAATIITPTTAPPSRRQAKRDEGRRSPRGLFAPTGCFHSERGRAERRSSRRRLGGSASPLMEKNNGAFVSPIAAILPHDSPRLSLPHLSSFARNRGPMPDNVWRNCVTPGLLAAECLIRSVTNRNCRD